MSISSNENETSIEKPATPIWRNILMALIAMPLMGVIGAALFTPFAELGIKDITTAVLVTILAEVLVIIIALAFTNKTKNWRDTLYLKNFTIKNFLLGVSTGAILFVGLQITSMIIALLGAKLHSSNTSEAISEVPGISKYIVMLILVPFIVPFVEELLYRSVVFGFIAKSGLKIHSKKITIILATLVSAAIFGFVHQQGFNSFTDVFVVLLTGTIGGVNCILLYKTDSIYTAYASHMSYNLLTSMISLAALASQHN